MKTNKLSDVSTWLNTIVTMLSLIVSTGISYVYFKENLFQVLIIVQFILITYLIIKLLFISLTNSPPLLNIKNKTIFDDFYDNEIKLVSQRKEQLNNGYLQLFGDEIERVQTELINYIKKTDSPVIRATDITNRPDILLTRNKYFEKNRAFTKDGGVIQRIMIIPDSNVPTSVYFESLLSIVKKNRECNVDIGLIPLSKLNKNEAQDFIIYDKFSVLVEGLQADPAYSYGTSTLFFKKNMYDEYDKLFMKLWENCELNPKEIALQFEISMEHTKENNTQFNYSNFLHQLIEET